MDIITKLLNWLEDRTGVISLLKVLGNRRWLKPLMGVKVLPALIAFLVVIQCVTGFILWMHYSPGSKSSYESVFYIQNVLWGGWFVRGIHHMAAQCVVAISILYVLQLIFTGLYRAPRELVFWTAITIVFCGLGACLTGDLLPWTQNGYGATMVRVKYLTQLPLVGSLLYQIVVGGDTVNNLTLTHFLAWHIGLFAAGMIGLVVLHGVFDARAERHWLNEKLADGTVKVPAQKPNSCGGCRSTGIARWWACQAAVNALACFIVVAGLLYTLYGGNQCKMSSYSPVKTASGEIANPGQYHGALLGAPADPSPTTSFGTARPEWTFRGLYQYALIFAGKLPECVLIFTIPAILCYLFYLMPCFALWKWGHPFNVIYTLVFCVIMVALTVTSYKNDAADGNFQLAQQEERATSARVFQLVQERGGLSEDGALAMLQSDWKTQGPKLFAKHCASCHPFAPLGDDKTAGPGIFRMEEPMAPNLYNYATPEWLAASCDKAGIRSKDFYGYKNSTLVKGDMASYVVDTLPEFLEDEELGAKGLQKILAILADETKRETPRKMAANPNEESDKKELPEGLDEETMFTFDDFTCTGCHKFYGSDGGTNSGPDLVLYGSKDWTKRMISDPTKFFTKNDRMLAYHPEAEGSDKNLMTDAELDMLVTWLLSEKAQPQK